MKIVRTALPKLMKPGMTYDLEKQFLPAGANLVIHPFSTEEALIEELKDADAVLMDFVYLSKNVIDKMDKCKVISFGSTGFTHVDMQAATDKGIPVCAIGEYCTQEVADHTLTVLLALNRELIAYNNAIQNDKIWSYSMVSGIRRLEGLTYGILGLGKIGQAVANRAKGFGLNIIAYDPYLPAHVAESLGVKLVDIDTLLAESDFISVHMAVGSENRGFLDYEKFKKMKKRPYVLNMSRGEAIEEDDLIKALDENLIRGAGLDVFKDESPDMATSPFNNRKNVIITPHAAFYSDDSVVANKRVSCENIKYVLSGEMSKVNKVVNGVGV